MVMKRITMNERGYYGKRMPIGERNNHFSFYVLKRNGGFLLSIWFEAERMAKHIKHALIYFLKYKNPFLSFVVVSFLFDLNMVQAH